MIEPAMQDASRFKAGRDAAFQARESVSERVTLPAWLPSGWTHDPLIAAPPLDDATFFEAVLHAAPAASTLFCTRDGFATFSQQATFSGRLHVDAHVAGNLLEDLRERNDAAGPVFVQARLVQEAIDRRVRALFQRVRALCGYDIEVDVQSECVGERFVEQWRAIMERRSTTIVVQSGTHLLPPALLRAHSLTVSEGGDGKTAQRGFGSAAFSDGAQAPTWARRVVTFDTRDNLAPNATTVASHAAFLVNADVAALAAMHEPLREPAYAVIFDIWIGNLRVLLDIGGDQTLARAAIARLEALRPQT